MRVFKKHGVGATNDFHPVVTFSKVYERVLASLGNWSVADTRRALEDLDRQTRDSLERLENLAILVSAVYKQSSL